jgi:hypothetical protein
MINMRIVQLKSKEKQAVALVNEPDLVLINNFESVFNLANYAIENNESLIKLINKNLSDSKINYDEVYNDNSEWKLMPPIHHPVDPRFCMLSGTGLTHMASAENRDHMHKAAEKNVATDSMKMYLLGLEGGKPPKGQIGIQPEWFYKGNGTLLKGYNEALYIPNYGNDGGEEPELAAVYINDKNGQPHRIGFATGNEFSDHVMEKKNYLYLAPSKIRNCSIGPELVLIDSIESVQGTVAIKRDNTIVWQKEVKTGEANMCHSLENLEYHHFKYQNHRVAGDLHIHFLGTQAFSFGAGITLNEGDIMEVKWENMGRALKNILKMDKTSENIIEINRI